MPQRPPGERPGSQRMVGGMQFGAFAPGMAPGYPQFVANIGLFPSLFGLAFVSRASPSPPPLSLVPPPLSLCPRSCTSLASLASLDSPVSAVPRVSRLSLCPLSALCPLPSPLLPAFPRSPVPYSLLFRTPMFVASRSPRQVSAPRGSDICVQQQQAPGMGTGMQGAGAHATGIPTPLLPPAPRCCVCGQEGATTQSQPKHTAVWRVCRSGRGRASSTGGHATA